MYAVVEPCTPDDVLGTSDDDVRLLRLYDVFGTSDRNASRALVNVKVL